MDVISPSKGNESLAVVEFAPYQKLPLDKKKVDGRNATIDQGMLSLSFPRTSLA
jgi:regulator of nonsense transcripts 3